MRISKEEIQVIKESVAALDKDAEIYLFGSRTDDTKRGGDIDILIISEMIDRAARRKIKRNFFDSFGEQHFDVVIASRISESKFSDPFADRIFPGSIKL